MTVTVPNSTWNPGTSVVRIAAGSASGTRRRASTGSRRRTRPRRSRVGRNCSAARPRSSTSPSATSASRRTQFRRPRVPAGCEPMPNVQHPNALSNPSWWRDNARPRCSGAATLLATPDISPFFKNVDFSKLAGAVERRDGRAADRRDEPDHGEPLRDRAGRRLQPRSCIRRDRATPASGWLRGRLQPYAIYVPTEPQPSGGYGLTLLLHSLGANYNQFWGARTSPSSASAGPARS